MVERIRVYKPKLHYHGVVWEISGPRSNATQMKLIEEIREWISDDKGNLVYARAKGLGVSTNIEEGSLAIKNALEYFYEENLKDFIIETNSLSLKQMILKRWKISWKLVKTIEDIRDNIQKLNVTITHTYREGSTIVDSLANGIIES